MTQSSSGGRIDRLIAAMTLDEKVGQLTMLAAEQAVTGPAVSADYAVRVREGACGSVLNLWGAERVRAVQRIAVEETRLGIPLFFGFDVIHGHRTIFPSPLGETSAFDPALWRRTARAAAAEAAADGIDLVFAPMLDIARDPRWGRIVESAGEDPYVAAQVAEAKIAGFQGDDLAAPDAVAATAKHFVGYGAVQAGREYASSDLSDRTLHEAHLPPFRAALGCGVAAIMPAFQDLAGVPMTAHRVLLRTLLRERWGFDGVLISDYGAVRELLAHGVAADVAEAAALALAAGVDIDMMGDVYATGIAPALANGKVTPALIDEAVRRVLCLKERLGLLDDPYRRTPAKPSPARAGEGWVGVSATARNLAREAACRAAVLLTNRNAVLPLDPAPRRIAVIGPLAEAGRDLLGPWAGAGGNTSPVTLAAGLRAALPGSEISTDETRAGEADLIVLCLGETADMSGEAASRGCPGLPGGQEALAQAALDSGKPVVVVLIAGRPLLVTDLAARADAMLMAWHPGSEGGNAIADLLTGREAPTGRLPLSWPAALGQVPIFFAQRPTGRPTGSDPHFSSCYIDQPAEPLFPFGHGLGYTRFAWRDLHAEWQGDTITVTAKIANEGERPGEETAFLFIRDPVASIARPLLELRGFTRVALDPGASGTAAFALPVSALAFPGPAPDFTPLLEPGDFEILVGPVADRRLLLSTTVRVP